MLGWLTEFLAAVTRGGRSWRPFLVGIVVLSTVMLAISVLVDERLIGDPHRGLDGEPAHVDGHGRPAIVDGADHAAVGGDLQGAAGYRCEMIH